MGHDGVTNHQPDDYLLNRLLRRRSKKNQSPASLAFVREIPRWLVNSPHKGSVSRKMVPICICVVKLKIVLFSNSYKQKLNTGSFKSLSESRLTIFFHHTASLNYNWKVCIPMITKCGRCGNITLCVKPLNVTECELLQLSLYRAIRDMHVNNISCRILLSTRIYWHYMHRKTATR